MKIYTSPSMNAADPKNPDSKPVQAPDLGPDGNPSQFPVRHPDEVPVSEPNEIPDQPQVIGSGSAIGGTGVNYPL